MECFEPKKKYPFTKFDIGLCTFFRFTYIALTKILLNLVLIAQSMHANHKFCKHTKPNCTKPNLVKFIRNLCVCVFGYKRVMLILLMLKPRNSSNQINHPVNREWKFGLFFIRRKQFRIYFREIFVFLSWFREFKEIKRSLVHINRRDRHVISLSNVKQNVVLLPKRNQNTQNEMELRKLNLRNSPAECFVHARVYCVLSYVSTRRHFASTSTK